LTGPIGSPVPASYSGGDTTVVRTNDSESILIFLSTSPEVGLVSQGLVSVVDTAGLTLTLRQNADGALVTPDSFEATWNLATTIGTVYGKASGEALFVDNAWQLRGISEVVGGSAPGATGKGGFAATLTQNGYGMADDVITWQFDAAIQYD